MQDWHPEDIKARLRKRGITGAAIELRYGLPRGTLAVALVKPHRRAERAIARTLRVAPEVIWPSRYNADGTRKSPQPSENYKVLGRFRAIASRSAA